MSALTELILAEVQRHEAQPSFNLRCKCGHIGTTVSRRGDFERHLSEALVTALTAVGLTDTSVKEAAETPESLS
jgi:hypothetical protein